jgi:hypothetical protein
MDGSGTPVERAVWPIKVGLWLILANLPQSLRKSIAQVVFIFGVQTPNMVSFRGNVYHSHIPLILKVLGRDRAYLAGARR